MKFHPFAEVFPLLEGDEFDSLVADIRDNGLKQIITLYQGKVLDGRNRFLACQKAKVKPRFHKFTGDDDTALAFVISANLHRRHLTTPQRAMAAARIATLQQGRPKLNASREAITQTDAAESLNVGRSSVQRARKVVEEGSKALQDAVTSGDVPLKKAASVTELPKREQLKAAKLTPEQKRVAQQVRKSLNKPTPAKPPEPDLDAWESEEDEAAQLEQAEKEYAASIDKVMAADDKLAEAHKEIKRQAAEIASLKLSRNQYQTRCEVLTRKVKSLQRQVKKLQRA